MNLKKQFVHHRNLLARGQTEISLFYGLINMCLLFWLFLRDVITVPRVWIVIIAPVCFLIALGMQYLVGYLMNRWKLIDELQKWDFERNPVVMGLVGKPEAGEPKDVFGFNDKPLSRICSVCGKTPPSKQKMVDVSIPKPFDKNPDNDPPDMDQPAGWRNDRLCEDCYNEYQRNRNR
jgi:hypothetical protein